jgi:hypothetical protein
MYITQPRKQTYESSVRLRQTAGRLFHKRQHPHPQNINHNHHNYKELTIPGSISPNLIRNRTASYSKCSCPVLFVEINMSLALSFSFVMSPSNASPVAQKACVRRDLPLTTTVLRIAIKETFFISHFNFPTI